MPIGVGSSSKLLFLIGMSRIKAVALVHDSQTRRLG